VKRRHDNCCARFDDGSMYNVILRDVVLSCAREKTILLLLERYCDFKVHSKIYLSNEDWHTV